MILWGIIIAAFANATLAAIASRVGLGLEASLLGLLVFVAGFSLGAGWL